MHTYGPTQLVLDLGLRRNYSWIFTIADVGRPIIGVDFLSLYNSLVDCRNQRLIDSLTSLPVPAAHCSTIDIASVKAIVGDTSYHHILREYSEITRPPGKQLPGTHNMLHHIRTTPSPPVACKPRRLNPARLLAKKEFKEMLASGVAAFRECLVSTIALGQEKGRRMNNT